MNAMHGHPSDLRAVPPPAALRGGRPAASAPRAHTEGGVEEVFSALGESGKKWMHLLSGELRLSLALWLRAAALLVFAVLLCAVAAGLFGALLVSLGLFFGLGWPASLALALFAFALIAYGCVRLSAKFLGESGLPATRRQLHLLRTCRETPP